MHKKLLIVFLSALISACGFHTPKLSDLAPPMHSLYFDSDNPRGELATEVARRLTAMGVKLVSSPSQAPIELHLTKEKFTSNQPVIFYSSNAVNFDYALSANYQLSWVKSHKLINGGNLLATQTLIHNANQTYTSGSDVMMRAQLIQIVASNLMFNLTNNGTRNAVERSQP